MKVGSKVICIDDSIPSHLNMEQFRNDFHQWIKKDEIYTIREILPNDGIVTSVLLEEVKNPIRFFSKTIGRFQESSFRIDRFRELTEADIEEEFKSEEDMVLEESLKFVSIS